MIKEFQNKKIRSQGFNPFERVNRTYILVDKKGDIIQIKRQISEDIDNRTEFLFMKYRQEDSEYRAYSQGEIMNIDLRKSLTDIFKK